jgi:RND family efflux transporter MFP subunit
MKFHRLRSLSRTLRLAVLGFALCLAPAALAQDTALSVRAKGLDANNNGVIDRDEARGPLAGSFDTIDRNKSGGLDGAEIRGFFRGGGTGGGTGGGAAKAKPSEKPGKALSGRAKGLDTNKNGVIDRDEARGPLKAGFDKADKDRGGTLDGAEISAFFRGGGGRRGRMSTVVVDPVIRNRGTETVPIYGRLVARQMGVVATQVRGAVAAIHAHVGDRVKKGDPLVLLLADTLKAERDLKAAELNEYKAKRESAKAQLALSNQELRRLENLQKSAAFSRSRLEDKRQDVALSRSVLTENRAKVQQARAELRIADINLYQATIRAPFNGVISKRHTDLGAYLNVGAQVLTMINDDSLEVEAEVPSARLSGLSDGALIQVEFEDNTPFNAAVRAIVPEENPLSRTRIVRFTADFGGNGKHVAVNQSVRLLIPVGPSRSMVSVHKDAVLLRGGRKVVYVIEGGQAKIRPVKLGEASGSRFEVLSGLKPGEKVVIRGNERLRPNSRVRVRPGGSS